MKQVQQVVSLLKNQSRGLYNIPLSNVHKLNVDESSSKQTFKQYNIDKILDKVNAQSVHAQYHRNSRGFEDVKDVINVNTSSSSGGGSAKDYRNMYLMFAGIVGYLSYESFERAIHNDGGTLADVNELSSLITKKEAVGFIESIKDQDIVVFLGNTRAGKGATVNLLLGNELEAFEDDGYKLSIKNLDESSGPTIGHKALSHTALPTGWNTKDSWFSKAPIKEMLVDVPGFDDNKGVSQDIANCFYIREILKNAKSTKIVLVSSINSIQDANIKPFLDLMEKVCTIIPNINNFSNCVSMIFSKVPQNLDSDKVCNMLTRKILQERGLNVSESARTLIKKLVDAKTICIIKEPKKAGKYTQEKETKYIFACINGLHKIERANLNGVKFGISDKSKVKVVEMSKELYDSPDFSGISDSITLYYINKVSEILSFPRTSNDKIVEAQNKLTALEKSFPSAVKAVDMLKQFCDLDLKIANRVKESGYIQKVGFVEYVDSLTGESLSGAVSDKLKLVSTAIKHKIEKEKINLRTDLSELERKKLIAEREKAAATDISNTTTSIKEKEKGYFRRVLEPLGKSLDEALLNSPKWLGSVLGKWTGWW